MRTVKLQKCYKNKLNGSLTRRISYDTVGNKEKIAGTLGEIFT